MTDVHRQVDSKLGRKEKPAPVQKVSECLHSLIQAGCSDL